MGPDRGGIDLGSERPEPRLVERRSCREEASGPAQEDHAGVEALAALDPRDDSDHRVLERLTGHHAAAAARRRCSATSMNGRGASSLRVRYATYARRWSSADPMTASSASQS